VPLLVVVGPQEERDQLVGCLVARVRRVVDLGFEAVDLRVGLLVGRQRVDLLPRAVLSDAGALLPAQQGPQGARDLPVLAAPVPRLAADRDRRVLARGCAAVGVEGVLVGGLALRLPGVRAGEDDDVDAAGPGGAGDAQKAEDLLR
jgi:hypothetical protein